MGDMVSYERVYSLTDVLGTARRCVSMCSESCTRVEGLTIDRRDLVARLPVFLRKSDCRFVRTELYWLYLARTSLSIELIS